MSVHTRLWADRVALARSLSCLASNLGIAGALCRGFFDGRFEGMESACAMEYGRRASVEWLPGCGRPAP